MEKRFVLAIALSLVVLLSWSAFISTTQHVDNKEVAQENSQQPLASKETSTISLAETEEKQPESLFNLSRVNSEVIFNEPAATIKEVEFKSYKSHRFPLGNGLLLEDKNLIFKKESALPDTVIFVHEDQTKKIIKRFIFSKDRYDIWLEIEVLNLSKEDLKMSLPLILETLDTSPKNIQARYQDITVATKEKIIRHNANVRKPLDFPETKFISSRDQYFCAILEPESDGWTGFMRKRGLQETEVGVTSKEIIIAPHQQIGQKIHLYIGPQDLKLINIVNPAWAAVINYGTFDFISQILLQLLEFLHGLFHNWGWAIIALSLIVYFILYPLTLKQMRSMKAMQVLQPRIEELRKNYKDNPQKLNKEIMELY
ncbi:MAG: membrane protein insertase YidC, partial [Candidatus Omnitrophica bacterium]|nr:membrane protein insertase YidC [Candidatus Omnitrophota bacterium]